MRWSLSDGPLVLRLEFLFNAIQRTLAEFLQFVKRASVIVKSDIVKKLKRTDVAVKLRLSVKTVDFRLRV